MRPGSLARLFVLSLMLVVQSAQAQRTLEHIFSAPQVRPSTGNQSVFVLEMAWTGCGGWDQDTLAVSVSGNVVTVTQTITNGGGTCIGATGVAFPIGSFAPGNYTLTYQAAHFAPGVGTYPPLTTQFSVGTGSIARVPALSPIGVVALAAGLLVAALVAVRSKSRVVRHRR